MCVIFYKYVVLNSHVGDIDSSTVASCSYFNESTVPGAVQFVAAGQRARVANVSTQFLYRQHLGGSCPITDLLNS